MCFLKLFCVLEYCAVLDINDWVERRTKLMIIAVSLDNGKSQCWDKMDARGVNECQGPETTTFGHATSFYSFAMCF